MLRRLINLWAWSDIEPTRQVRAKNKVLYPENLPTAEGVQAIFIDNRNPVETLDIS